MGRVNLQVPEGGGHSGNACLSRRVVLRLDLRAVYGRENIQKMRQSRD